MGEFRRICRVGAAPSCQKELTSFHMSAIERIDQNNVESGIDPEWFGERVYQQLSKIRNVSW